MNQTAIGSYIARKRKEQNLTQEQLAQQLSVSNKTISKWENGKCMPDYSIIEPLCDALHVTLPELMDGEDAAEDSVRIYDDEQILDLLRRTQELERQKGVLCGFVLIVLGIASGAMSKTTGGTDVQDFISGVLMGLSVAEILAGIWAAGKKLLKQQKSQPPAKNAGDWLMLGYYSMAIAVEEASFFTSSFGTMTLRTPSSYFALTSSGLTLPT